MHAHLHEVEIKSKLIFVLIHCFDLMDISSEETQVMLFCMYTAVASNGDHKLPCQVMAIHLA